MQNIFLNISTFGKPLKKAIQLEEKVFKFFFSKRNCTPCPVGTKSEKGERSRNSYQLAPFHGWKGGE